MAYQITDNIEEMTALGRQIAEEHRDVYPEEMLRAAAETFGEFFPDTESVYNTYYRAIYSQAVYGTSIQEYVMYGFDGKTHEEKTHYITWYSRFVYMAFMNRAQDIHVLDNKYEAYTKLTPFYKRDAMLLSGEKDYDAFRDFVGKHSSVFVKPNNLGLAEGVHRLTVSDTDNLREVFQALLREAAGISSDRIRRKIDHSLILEEEIIPSACISRINPGEMSLLRVTTVTVRGQVHFFYPCLRLLFGDGQSRRGESYSYDALIDADTGIVVTNGKNGVGDADFHPVTGIPIKGLVMPEWDSLKAMLTEAARVFPTVRYIGWDVVHTDRGWCIIEGNTSGEFFAQMCIGHGVKDEFEKLIGFSVPYDFWQKYDSPF